MTHAERPIGPGPDWHSNQVRLASGINFLAGVYLVISGWIGGVSAGNVWNSVIAGIVVLILAAIRLTGNAGPWASWIVALIGVWLIIAPWVYGYGGYGWRWNGIIVGIIAIICGVWSALAGRTGTDAAV
jgi:hypothetical protein